MIITIRTGIVRDSDNSTKPTDLIPRKIIHNLISNTSKKNKNQNTVLECHNKYLTLFWILWTETHPYITTICSGTQVCLRRTSSWDVRQSEILIKESPLALLLQKYKIHHLPLSIPGLECSVVERDQEFWRFLSHWEGCQTIQIFFFKQNLGID